MQTKRLPQATPIHFHQTSDVRQPATDISVFRIFRDLNEVMKVRMNGKSRPLLLTARRKNAIQTNRPMDRYILLDRTLSHPLRLVPRSRHTDEFNHRPSNPRSLHFVEVGQTHHIHQFTRISQTLAV